MSGVENRPLSFGGSALTEHSVNGVSVIPDFADDRDTPTQWLPIARGRHRRGPNDHARIASREVPQHQIARLRLLTGSALGVACLFLAQGLALDQGSLFAAPSSGRGWAAIFFGIVGLWLVPGLWLSAVMMRFGVGAVAWLGTRIATTLAWYALVGPVSHYSSQGARVTTGGILAVTTAATAAVALGIALGLSSRPEKRWARALSAALVGGACAQTAMWASRWLQADDTDFLHRSPLNWSIVLGGALLVTVGTLSRPTLPLMLTARTMHTPLVALAVIAATAAALVTAGARWSPAQVMPSSFGAEQVAAPPGADVAFALTAIGPEGTELIRRAEFTASDDVGRPVATDMRLIPAGGTADHARLLVSLQRTSQPVLCTGIERRIDEYDTVLPVKLIVRERHTGTLVQAVIPDRWCGG